jgi:hypothetical protein
MTENADQIRISGVDMADWISRIVQAYYDQFASRPTSSADRMHQLQLAATLTDEFARQVTQAMLAREEVLDALIDLEGVRAILRARAERDAEVMRKEEERQVAAQERRRKKLADELAALQEEGGSS